VRRLTAALVVIGLFAVPLTASASQTEKYKDKFTSISWWGSDGSLPWSDPWVEINDDGDEKKGNVRVVSSGSCKSGNCLWIGALTTLLGQIGARRPADTSGFEDLFLRFDLHATASLLASELEVQVRGGGGWTTVAEYQLGTELDVSPTIDISGYRSADFQVRYLFSGLLLSSEVFIDNVEIYGSTIEPTTTTTTTAPTTTTTTTAPTTTTTTTPTTTSSAPAVTSTSQPGATSTTKHDSGEKPDTGKSTTTTSVPATTTTVPGSGATSSSSTSTSTTTSTVVALAGGDGSSGPGAPDGGGLRLAARGLQANFQGDLYGEVRGVTYLNGVDLQADYNMAVEIIEASWGWIVLLGLVVAYSILSGLDRRRRRTDI
jgi:hypothetical protein